MQKSLHMCSVFCSLASVEATTICLCAPSARMRGMRGFGRALGYPSGQNPLEATEPFPPSGRAASWRHAKLGPRVGEAKPHGKSPWGLPPSRHYLPTYLGCMPVTLSN